MRKALLGVLFLLAIIGPVAPPVGAGARKHLSVSVVYIDPHYYLGDGTPGYYIDSPYVMIYKVRLQNLGTGRFERLTLIAILEYYGSGNPLPAESMRVWNDVYLGPGATLLIADDYSAPPSTSPGLVRMHVILKHMNEGGPSAGVFYDEPETGVFSMDNPARITEDSEYIYMESDIMKVTLKKYDGTTISDLQLHGQSFLDCLSCQANIPGDPNFYQSYAYPNATYTITNNAVTVTGLLNSYHKYNIPLEYTYTFTMTDADFTAVLRHRFLEELTLDFLYCWAFMDYEVDIICMDDREYCINHTDEWQSLERLIGDKTEVIKMHRSGVWLKLYTTVDIGVYNREQLASGPVCSEYSRIHVFCHYPQSVFPKGAIVQQTWIFTP